MFWANPFWQSYISAACADRQSSICLASQYHDTRRFCARGDGMPPCCLATGRWGAARRRLDTEILQGTLLPAPLPGLMKNRQVDMTKIKSLLQKRQMSLCPGHEWLAIVVLWFHWNVFILATATSTFEQINSARNGSDRASDWAYQESTSCHMRKKRFFCSLNFFCEKFSIKHCSTHNMWIRWSFRSISSSYFHRNIMYI